MTHDASLAQIVAARPDASTWLSANAGSGKTKVLTDRVARLLMNRVEPQHILCLTYTKAAATEMQNRLFKRLGTWAMLPDAALRQDLAQLGEGEELDASRLALARQLFARAIETPGGLRIQTIHSFCASLLRRYPLESGVTPAFVEMDDRTARQLRDEIVQDMADRLAPAEVAALAHHYSAEDFDGILREICSFSDDFAAPLTEGDSRAHFGLAADDTEARLLGDVFLGDEADVLPALLQVLASGSSADLKAAAKLSAGMPFAPTLDCLGVLDSVFLTQSGANPYSAKIGSFPTKASRSALSDRMDRIEALMARVASARDRRVGLAAARKAMALHGFAHRFLELYDARKAARGLLDFDDLIRKAARLLNDPSLAAWVLFRLDGGIDHILVDEAQDTSPAQWAVIERLAAEYTAGDGASDKTRTLFVVGDKKQSIYSFQGADLSAFDAKRLDFRARFEGIGQPMQDRTLDYSFRSSPAVLDVVDATFAPGFVDALGAPPRHLAFMDRLPGRVDLWPLIPKAEKTKDEDGWSPVDLISDSHHTVELARQIASEIRAMIDTGVQVPDKAGVFHSAHEGDFLILVRRRGPLFSQIIRACKQEGLAIAGADRLKLGEEIAVKDLLALLAFLVTPEDSLSLAAALRSPLFGWSEDRLYRLAQGRAGHLWAALRDSGFDQTLQILNDLRSQADFLRPYEILDRILTRHDGRMRLLTRLGLEAEDGIDELLTQALVYEQTDVPSLTGFLIWLEHDDVEVKRQQEGEGHRIRVMTVHGAKGLEAPIVILPDTADYTAPARNEVYRLESGFPVWKTAAAESPEAISLARAEAMAKAQAESLRLLYVALTRARCWLIIAGAGDARTETKDGPKPRESWSWYRQVEAGLKTLGAGPGPSGRVRHQVGDWPPPGISTRPELPVVHLPDWVLTPPPDAARPVPFVSPSDLGGAKALPGEGDDPETATARGSVLHALLEHLPACDPQLWPDLARALVPEPFSAEALLSEASGVLSSPALAPLFGADSLAEVSVTATWQDRRLVGTIDRLILGPDRVLAVDFKSNRVVPGSVDQVPEGVLRQMGAYAHALGQIYPGKQIETAILWTCDATLMPLDPDIVTAALLRATIA